MKNDIKNILITFLISIVVVYLCYVINSKSIFNYLNENLLTILLAFLAINTATLGHLAAKIQDIMILYKSLDFKNTIKEMKKSLVEQIIMIGLLILIITIKESDLTFSLKAEILDVFSLSIFLYAIYILWDTGKSVFIIIEEVKKLH